MGIGANVRRPRSDNSVGNCFGVWLPAGSPLGRPVPNCCSLPRPSRFPKAVGKGKKMSFRIMMNPLSPCKSPFGHLRETVASYSGGPCLSVLLLIASTPREAPLNLFTVDGARVKCGQRRNGKRGEGKQSGDGWAMIANV